MKNTTRLELLIPTAVADNYSDKSLVARAVLEDIVVLQRHLGWLSIGEAAALLQISYSDMGALIHAKQLPLENSTEAEQQANYHHFKARLSEV